MERHARVAVFILIRFKAIRAFAEANEPEKAEEIYERPGPCCIETVDLEQLECTQAGERDWLTYHDFSMFLTCIMTNITRHG